MTHKQIKHFNFSGEEDQGFQDMNYFLRKHNAIQIIANNNGYGSHIYIVYMADVKE